MGRREGVSILGFETASNARIRYGFVKRRGV